MSSPTVSPIVFFVTENGTMTESAARCGPPTASSTRVPSWYAATWNDRSGSPREHAVETVDDTREAIVGDSCSDAGERARGSRVDRPIDAERQVGDGRAGTERVRAGLDDPLAVPVREAARRNRDARP